MVAIFEHVSLPTILPFLHLLFLALVVIYDWFPASLLAYPAIPVERLRLCNITHFIGFIALIINIRSWFLLLTDSSGIGTIERTGFRNLVKETGAFILLRQYVLKILILFNHIFLFHTTGGLVDLRCMLRIHYNFTLWRLDFWHIVLQKVVYIGISLLNRFIFRPIRLNWLHFLV